MEEMGSAKLVLVRQLELFNLKGDLWEANHLKVLNILVGLLHIRVVFEARERAKDFIGDFGLFCDVFFVVQTKDDEKVTKWDTSWFEVFWWLIQIDFFFFNIFLC